MGPGSGFQARRTQMGSELRALAAAGGILALVFKRAAEHILW